MKKTICTFLLIGLVSLLFGSKREQYVISDILDNDVVKINIGKQDNVKTGDIYQVNVKNKKTGKSFVVSKLVVTKVFSKESLAKVIEGKDLCFVGDKISKEILREFDDLIPFEEFEKQQKIEPVQEKKIPKTNPKKTSQNPTTNKKMWVDGPFILGHNDFLIGLRQYGDLLVGVGDNFKYFSKHEDEYIYLAPTLQYGFWDRFQIGVEIPFVYRRFEGSYSKDTVSYDLKGSGMGISDIKLNLLFSQGLNKSNTLKFSLGSILSIPTDAGLMKISDIDNEGNQEFELNNSMGYMVYSFLGGVGLKTQKSYTFVEYVFDINGKKKGWTYEYNGKTYTKEDYEHDYSSDVKLVSSYFINKNNKLKLKLLLEFNETLVEKDSDNAKITCFSIVPSYVFAWKKIMFEVELDYSLNYPNMVGSTFSIKF